MVSRMSSYYLSCCVFSWRSSLEVALNLTKNRPLGAWERSAFCGAPAFIFM